MTLSELKKELRAHIEPEKAALFPRFFKTAKGEYGEGDHFLGVRVPPIRELALAFCTNNLPNHQKLLSSKWHEERHLAIYSLCLMYKKADQKNKKIIFKFINGNLDSVNNWDLVDTLAPNLYGPYILEFDRFSLLKKHAKSEKLWVRRIAIVSTFAHLRSNSTRETYEIVDMLIGDEHDLIHKATGWLLREAGKRDLDKLYAYLDKNASIMPRTMLRYAIEKVPEMRRKKILTQSR